MVSARPGTVATVGGFPEQPASQQKLQTVVKRIYAATSVEDLSGELTEALCDAFDADRITIYVTKEEKTSIVSRVKTGLASFKDIKLPINEQSVAGYVAVHKRLLNIRDVYDQTELKSHRPPLTFLKAVDLKTGYRTQQMLGRPGHQFPQRHAISTFDGGWAGAGRGGARHPAPAASAAGDDAAQEQVRGSGRQRSIVF
jgi:hypothetical protein